jgi:hypothetical protein
MPEFPVYIQRMLDQAREQGQWYCGQSDAAAICFDVLALFPDHQQAAELVYQLFCDEWLIYDNRNALQQQIDEWDDRPWQQRRRMALSLRFMSRWEGWYAEEERGRSRASFGPPDVADALQAGRDLLLEAYCLGDEECTDMAWPVFVEAFERTGDPQGALMWVGKQYADLGFFADAVEVLAELCARFDDERARRLLAEVRWWRDHAHRLPWLPPPGDGSRYRRMMAFIDPGAPSDEQVIGDLRARAAARQAARGVAGQPPRPVVAPEVAQLIEAALPKPAAPSLSPALVDWSFLDRDDGRPGELPDWAKKTMRLFEGQLPHDIVDRYRWSRPIARPSNPPRHNPAEPPFDPDEFLDLDEPPELDEPPI